jgi:hypothetical protein
MRTQLLAAPLLTFVAGTVALTQEITPVWVEHVNDLINVTAEDKLPILVRAGGTGDNTYNFDGTDVIDSYAKFLKYDDDHYLLGVRENGINESDPNLSQAQKDMAAKFPDRSIIWIDARTGKPLGIALRTEVFPVSLAAPDQSATHAWWKWGIQDGAHGQRAIYTGYKYKILRYAPDVLVDDPNFPNKRPTWKATPTEAWVEPVPGEPNPTVPPYVTPDLLSEWVDSSSGDGSASWRLKAFRVTGSGNDTRVWAGGATWRSSMTEQEFVTEDGGLTFYPIARLNDRGDGGGAKGYYSLGGEPSSLRTTPGDPDKPGMEWCVQGHYPGTGWTARPNRYVKNPNGTNPCATNDVPIPWWKCTTTALGNSKTNQPTRPNYFDPVEGPVGSLPAFNWEAAGKDGKPINHKVDGVERYDGNWVMTSDTKDGVDYIVTYAIPSWDQQFGKVGEATAVFKPGWIGLHTLDGKISTGNSEGKNNAFKIPVYETDEPIVDPNGNGGTGHDYGYDGDVEVYPDADGKGGATVLWCGAIYGFGVFRVQNIPAAITQQPQSASKTAGESVTFTAAASGGANLYQWLKDGVPIPLATSTSYTIDRLKVSDSGKYRLRVLNRLGNVESDDAVLVVTVDDVPPTIMSVSGSANPARTVFWVTVVFSERVTAETAGTRSNYQISGGVTVSEVVVNNDTTVTLKTTAQTEGTEYILTVNNVKDQSPAGNVIAPNTKKTFKWTLTTGYVLWELYPDIDGTAVDALVNDADFPDNPGRREYLTSFSTIPQMGNDVAERFGARVSGFLTPTESGNYEFFLRSDDASELYLSTDDKPENRVAIAMETGCCAAFLEYDQATRGQTSVPQALNAGKKYYLEALYKEGGGGDYIEVAWRKEGDTTPAGDLKPIPGSFLSAYHPVALAAPKFDLPVLSNGQVTITWTGPGRLQESSDLKGWVDVAGNPASGYKVTPAAGEHKFYRLVQ